MSWGEKYAWRHATATMPHVAFPWKVNYAALSVLVPEQVALRTQMGAEEQADEEALKSGSFAAKQAYLFTVRDDLVYGWGSPVKAAVNAWLGKQGGHDRFGRVAENLVYEASCRIAGKPLPFRPCPRAWTGGGGRCQRAGSGKREAVPIESLNIDRSISPAARSGPRCGLLGRGPTGDAIAVRHKATRHAPRHATPHATPPPSPR